jgi:hypothetical protein
MAPRQIHLNLLDVSGPSWIAITPEAIDRLEREIRDLPILGVEPDQYSIAGVARVGDVIGGFFVTQYEHEALEYDSTKQEKRINYAEWEKTVFALFPRIGKALFQSQQYPKGLTRDHVYELFRNTIGEVIRRAQLSNTTLITPLTQQEIPDEQFIQTFDDPANRVEKLIVDDLRPNPALEGLTYYNPQRDRNRIIAESHIHDFDILKRVEMETSKTKPDLRSVHFAKSAVRSGKNQEMSYTIASGDRHVLRRNVRENYETSIDMDVDTIRQDDLQKLAEQVLEQYGIYREPRIPPSLPDQCTMFDILGGDQ